MAPGRGLPVYQPATVVLPGTCRAPDLVIPSRISRVRTPIDGIVSETGPETCAEVCGTGVCSRPAGASTGFTGATRGGT